MSERDPATSERDPATEIRCHGHLTDGHTRCVHWYGPTDIVAIRMRCCGRFYACSDCHAACEDHAIERWPRADFGEEAILCGACRRTMSIEAYLASGDRCPSCGAGFNPRCALHRGRYFEMG